MNKAQQELRNELLDEMDDLLALAKKEKRHFKVSETNRIEAIKSQIAEIERESQLNQMQKEDRMVITKGDKVHMNEKEQRKLQESEERAFIDFIKGDVRALNAGSNGSIIPVSVASRVIDKVINISPLLSKVELYKVKEDLQLPIYDFTQHTTAYQTEFTDMVESAGTFSAVTLKSLIIGSLTKIGRSLINRTDNFDVLGYVINALAKSISLFLENELIKGTGGAGKIQGSLATGVTQQVAGATTLVITYPELVAMQTKIPAHYDPNCAWLMNPATLGYIKSMVDSQGRPLNLFENGLLLDKPVMISDAVDVNGVGKKALYYGDFSCMKVKMTQDVQIQVLQELYAKQYAVGIAGYVEIDGSVAEPQGLAVYVGK
ncbi:phage major capsid protein [Bacillus sp. AFS029533]|uniref:phage major capsid protein n=1 Tax=Bacillus sp. AFS029533 TaxID=2033494 RepID=UPI000BFB83FC|nr:phage major capsid protein [Bacillus sp. AFS029533]PGZ88988.1 phage major capsid protein [Bacillus sp. AFS029533]